MLQVNVGALVLNSDDLALDAEATFSNFDFENFYLSVTRHFGTGRRNRRSRLSGESLSAAVSDADAT